MLKKIHRLAQKFEEFSMENGIQRLFKDFPKNSRTFQDCANPIPSPPPKGIWKMYPNIILYFLYYFIFFDVKNQSHVMSVRGASSIKIIIIINCTIIHYTHKQVSLDCIFFSYFQ